MRRLLALAALLALAPLGAAQTAYRIDPAHSAITYAMSHPAHSWTGTSHHVSGTVSVSDGKVTGGRASAPIVSFDSGNRSRDSNMASDTEAYLFPNVTFEARSVTVQDGGRASVRGTLTFHGVSRAVTVPAEVSVSGDRARLQGEFAVTLSEFGIEPPSLMMVKSRDWVGLTFDLVAVR